jgi:transcriptional regulator with XRE-family HTH domain
MTYKELCAFLKQKRIGRRHKPESLAIIVGVSVSSLSSWESGKRTPTMFNLHAWANALGYDLEFTLTPRPTHGAIYVKPD